jgi:hypothetical protein
MTQQLTLEQISIVLEAVVMVESWDLEHPAIAEYGPGEWIVDTNLLPVPSTQLIERVRELEQHINNVQNERNSRCAE